MLITRVLETKNFKIHIKFFNLIFQKLCCINNKSAIMTKRVQNKKKKKTWNEWEKYFPNISHLKFFPFLYHKYVYNLWKIAQYLSRIAIFKTFFSRSYTMYVKNFVWWRKRRKKFVTLCAIDDECAPFSFLPIIAPYMHECCICMMKIMFEMYHENFNFFCF